MPDTTMTVGTYLGSLSIALTCFMHWFAVVKRTHADSIVPPIAPAFLTAMQGPADWKDKRMMRLLRQARRVTIVRANLCNGCLSDVCNV
jgi:hypothetical protein